MLPPPMGERGSYPHSRRRELPNDGKKGFNRAEGGKKIYDNKRMLWDLPGYFLFRIFLVQAARIGRIDKYQSSTLYYIP
jgi:hypothetical protein